MTGTPDTRDRSIPAPGRDVRIALVGNRGGTNVGASLMDAARISGNPIRLADASSAMSGPAWLRSLKWHFGDHTPARLRQFSDEVVALCREFRPGLLLTTGVAPVALAALEQIGALGIQRCNYSTDDPWNPAHRAGWFLNALSGYDFIFTPRVANVGEMKRVSRAQVFLLPFGYDPALFFPENLTPEEAKNLASDVVFAGAADRDRVPYIAAFNQAGFKVALYGAFWDRFSETRSLSHGQADVQQLRKATAASKVALCLVRRANRDGHSMRTFEMPAMKACMVVEKTDDHVRLFGPEGAAVLYFEGAAEAVAKTQWLLDRPEDRTRMAASVHRLVVEGEHTYMHRLGTILAACNPDGCRI